jgi:hypothetical protein
MFFIEKRFFLIISLIIMMPIFMMPTLVTAEDLTVIDISTKKMSEVDSSGDVWFSVRAVIRNNTSEPKNVVLNIQAVDSEGFELKSVSLRGRIPANVPDSITDKTYMPDKQYRAIDKWKVAFIREN